MKGKAINTIFSYLLILSLSVALLFAQTNKLHLHTQHEHGGHQSVVVADVHIASTPHNGTHSHHDAVDVSSNIFVKNLNILNPLIFILLFIGLSLSIARRVYLCCSLRYKACFTSSFYLFLPPLRAPPIK